MAKTANANTLQVEVPPDVREVLDEEAPKECRTAEQLAAWVVILWARDKRKTRTSARAATVPTGNGATQELAHAV